MAVAIGADSVACSLHQGAPDVLLPAADCFEVQSLFADVESVTPGAANDAHLTRPGSAHLLGEINDTLRI